LKIFAHPPHATHDHGRVETSIENGFYRLGERIADRPRTYIVVPVVCFLLCFIGFSVFQVCSYFVFFEVEKFSKEIFFNTMSN
jgi:hypothetical protein